jgi:hypothetical protein
MINKTIKITTSEIEVNLGSEDVLSLFPSATQEEFESIRDYVNNSLEENPNIGGIISEYFIHNEATLERYSLVLFILAYLCGISVGQHLTYETMFPENVDPIDNLLGK